MEEMKIEWAVFEDEKVWQALKRNQQRYRKRRRARSRQVDKEMGLANKTRKRLGRLRLKE